MSGSCAVTVCLSGYGSLGVEVAFDDFVKGYGVSLYRRESKRGLVLVNAGEALRAMYRVVTDMTTDGAKSVIDKRCL